MYCTNCGAQNPDAAKYCQNCGSALPGSPPVAHGDVPPPPLAPPPVVYAGFWRRFVALIIDRLILGVVNGILFLIFGLHILRSIGFCFEFPCELTVAAVPMILSILAGAVWLAVVAALIHILYFVLMESSQNQATLGKMALGIIVTDMYGRRVTFGRALGRNLGKILSSMILMIGFIMAGLTAKKQALHDLMADCLVVMR
ncbi:RDD family protein [bacterium]|nr:RDD family protein [bacterium]MBU1983128.1 RDD family protein [bacterium]